MYPVLCPFRRSQSSRSGPASREAFRMRVNPSPGSGPGRGQWSHEDTAQPPLAALRRALARNRILCGRDHLLPAGDHHPLGTCVVPDRELRALAVRAHRGGPARRHRRVFPAGERHLAAGRGHLDRDRPCGDRLRHGHHHHRHPPGHRQPQLHPGLADAAGQADRAERPAVRNHLQGLPLDRIRGGPPCPSMPAPQRPAPAAPHRTTSSCWSSPANSRPP